MKNFSQQSDRKQATVITAMMKAIQSKVANNEVSHTAFISDYAKQFISEYNPDSDNPYQYQPNRL